ncbi:MAG: single-stranded-DNA-specific exonuclease RecJ [Lachnospiraceae bacterium]
MAKWYVTMKQGDFNGIAQRLHISPMIARIIRNRGMIGDAETEQFLSGTLADMHSPNLMKDMEQACLILKEKIQQGKKIRIIGDYDIDGICATYILKKGLVYCGAIVDTEIPHRIIDGYGLNEELVRIAYEAGIDTIVTCDNGIAAYEQIEDANQHGMTVIITDHHEVPKRIPSAAAVIDPKQEDCHYPYEGICGAVVAYKLIVCLLAGMGIDAKEELLCELLTFAAMATVGDVMDLIDENRIIVKYGLREIAATKNPGLHALLVVTELEGKEITPYHIGYILGPCLNASGRLDTAKRALELFETTNTAEANRIAGDLKALNDSRKEMTVGGVKEAVEQVEAANYSFDKVIVLYLPHCHESLAGIIAGKVRERYDRPSFVFTDAEEGVKGSGRSIEAYSMYEELKKHQELYTKFGGHKMAAGLSMPTENVERFRQVINATCTLTEEDCIPKIQIDIPMPLIYATKELAEEINILEPFGNGNPKPVFAQKNLRLLSGRLMGAKTNVGKYVVEDEQHNRFTCIYFGDIQKLHGEIVHQYDKAMQEALYTPQGIDIPISIVYAMDINEYRGNRNLQIIMKDYDLAVCK